MSKKEQINTLVEEALSSVEDIKRAEPKPFLLTRIAARLSNKRETTWEKAAWYLGRPAVAFTGLCIVMLINVLVVMSNKSSSSTPAIDQVAQTQGDEFSYTVATIYDFENNQP